MYTHEVVFCVRASKYYKVPESFFEADSIIVCLY